MKFKEKLALLMTATGLSNSTLARALSLDPSLISRWRTGTRVPSQNSPRIEALAQYFASLAKTDYRKAALCGVLGVPPEKSPLLDKAALAEMLYAWLSSGAAPDPALIDGLMGRLEAACAVPRSPAPFHPAPTETEPVPPGGTAVFYGTEGKRSAARKFLCSVLAQNRPATSFLYSEESMNWMTGDGEFLQKLFSLLYEVLARGHLIKIVHVLNRGLSELLAAIEFWLPLYLTGRIEPYYCPRYRDHYFRRTVFAAPGAAVVSCALAGHEDLAVTHFCTDPKTADFLTREFGAFLNSMCRPLVRIFTGSRPPGLEEFLAEFYEKPGDYIYTAGQLSPLTMPEEVFSSLLERSGLAGDSKEKTFSEWHRKRKAFFKGLERGSFIEISSLPSPEEVAAGLARADLGCIWAGAPVYYRPQEYSCHLQNIARLLQSHEGFLFVASRRALWQNVRLLVKDGAGAVAVKTSQPPAVFTFSQPNMVNAFYCYLEDAVGGLPPKEKDRTRTAAALLELSEKLRCP